MSCLQSLVSEFQVISVLINNQLLHDEFEEFYPQMIKRLIKLNDSSKKGLKKDTPPKKPLA